MSRNLTNLILVASGVIHVNTIVRFSEQILIILQGRKALFPEGPDCLLVSIAVLGVVLDHLLIQSLCAISDISQSLVEECLGIVELFLNGVNLILNKSSLLFVLLIKQLFNYMLILIIQC